MNQILSGDFHFLFIPMNEECWDLLYVKIRFTQGLLVAVDILPSSSLWSLSGLRLNSLNDEFFLRGNVGPAIGSSSKTGHAVFIAWQTLDCIHLIQMRSCGDLHAARYLSQLRALHVIGGNTNGTFIIWRLIRNIGSGLLFVGCFVLAFEGFEYPAGWS
ncbi:hypothetical protein ABKN59_008173 [Abortiporus biennis]